MSRNIIMQVLYLADSIIQRRQPIVIKKAVTSSALI